MTIEATVEAVASAPSWEARVSLIRKIPETFGTAQHAGVYSALAARIYVPNLAQDFAYVYWRDEYELGPLEAAYRAAFDLTRGFTAVTPEDLTRTILTSPITLRIFRLLVAFTAQEFAEALSSVAHDVGGKALSPSRIKAIEAGGTIPAPAAALCATVIDRAMGGQLFPPPATDALKSKIHKPDTIDGWNTVRLYARDGVPLAVFLHQRHYGGAFRQLLDATSSDRGGVLETAVASLFDARGVSYLQTGSSDQPEIARRFGVTVRPAPDFVVFSERDTLRAILECKFANDGGTARDKAARFRSLRAEASRLGGIPVFAVLAGLGWKRTADALGPVVQHTDGRTFTLPNLNEMLTVQPFPDLVRPVP